MISAIEIEHYKSIDRARIDFGPITVLVGPNGSGKSNIIDALRFVRDTMRYDLDRALTDRHGIDSVRQWSASRPYNITLRVEVEEGEQSGYYKLVLGSNRGRAKVLLEEAYWSEDEDVTEYDPEHEVMYQIGTAHCTYFISRDRNGKITYKSTKDDSVDKILSDQISSNEDTLFSRPMIFPSEFREIRRFRMDFSSLIRAITDIESYSIFPNTLRQPQLPANDERLSSSGDNLASVFRSWTKRESSNRARSKIVETMQKVMPHLESLRVQNIAGFLTIMFRVHEKTGNTHDLNVSQVSDGTLRVLGLLSAIYQPRGPSLLALEEPEQTIHYGILKLLGDSLIEVSQQKQIVVTTHSPFFIDNFDVDWVYATEQVNHMTKVGRLSPHQKEAVKERLFSLGEIMISEGLYPEDAT